MNKKDLPIVTSKVIEQKEVILYNLNTFYCKVINNTSIKYRLIIDVICEHYNFHELRQYLYFKDNVQHRLKVQEILNFTENLSS